MRNQRRHTASRNHAVGKLRAAHFLEVLGFKVFANIVRQGDVAADLIAVRGDEAYVFTVRYGASSNVRRTKLQKRSGVLLLCGDEDGNWRIGGRPTTKREAA